MAFTYAITTIVCRIILAHDAGFENQANEVEILNEIFDSGNDLWEKEFGFRLPDENELERKTKT
ncbi:hypothetical protein NF868_11115 [Bacillus zhangzhouensis]|nr:hypothetical protein NF868_11115 [Bacillus zhangzhouensis]